MKRNPVYRSLNKPMTILGVERRLAFFNLTIGLALFQLSNAMLPALVLVCVLHVGARLATASDPQLLRVLINSTRFVRRYDPGKPKAGGR